MSFMVGWGRVYQDYLWVAEAIGEPAPTTLSKYFIMPCRLGSPKSLTPTNK